MLCSVVLCCAVELVWLVNGQVNLFGKVIESRVVIMMFILSCNK